MIATRVTITRTLITSIRASLYTPRPHAGPLLSLWQGVLAILADAPCHPRPARRVRESRALAVASWRSQASRVGRVRAQSRTGAIGQSRSRCIGPLRACLAARALPAGSPVPAGQPFASGTAGLRSADTIRDGRWPLPAGESRLGAVLRLSRSLARGEFRGRCANRHHGPARRPSRSRTRSGPRGTR